MTLFELGMSLMSLDELLPFFNHQLSNILKKNSRFFFTLGTVVV